MQTNKYFDKIALKTTTNVWSYHDVKNEANRVAQELLNHRLDNSPIALLFKPGPKVIPALLGAAKIGRTWSALDPSWPKARLSQIMEDLGSSMLLTETDTLQTVRSLNGIADNVINLDDFQDYTSCEYINADISPDSPFSIIYTSGSTGKPKGVIQTHRNILHYVQEQSIALSIRSRDRFSQFYTPVYMTGIMSTLRALLNGATLFFYNPKGEEELPLSKWIERKKITFLHLSPSLFQYMAESLTEKRSLSTVRLIYMTGEPVSSHIVALYKKLFSPHCILVNNLGSTEASSHSRYFIDHKTHVKGNRVPVGYPVEGKDIYLLDKKGDRLSNGQIGEIAIGSQYLSPGYWGDHELTRRKFRSDHEGDDKRIYMTGDLGKMMPDGCLEHLERSDYQIQIRGYRVELGEIESMIMQYPGVRQTVVICNEHRNRKILTAYFVFKKGEGLPSRKIRDFLKKYLPDHMIPNSFISIDSMPLTPNGKINRNALPACDFASPLTDEEYIAPKNPLESKMAKIWGRLLDIHSVGIKDNFFDLGGDSLLAARLIIEIEKMFNLRLPLTTILDKPTIEQLVSCFDRKGSSPSWSSLAPIKPSGYRNPLFLVHPISGNVLCYRNLSKYLDPEQPLYALQALGFKKDQSPLYKIEDMAAHYISDIQKIQPEGPYRIGGACMGGMVAFEMACQLREKKQDVTLLAMIDSPNPLRFIEPHGISRGKTNRPSFVHHLKKAIKHAMKGDLNNAYAKGKKMLDGTPFELPKSGFERVRAANAKARARYFGRVYPGPITFFWLTINPNGLKTRWNPNFGWIHLAEKGIRIITLPLRHQKNYLREPYIRLIATELNKCLQQTYK